MKRNGVEHPKTAKLARFLDQHYGGLPDKELARNAAVGMLERLFHFAARYAPRGDVGRHPVEEIADAMGWTGKPDTLIGALLAIGWLEQLPDGLVVIHEWSVHADNATRIQLERRDVETFADGAPLRSRRRRAPAPRDELDPAQYADEPVITTPAVITANHRVQRRYDSPSSSPAPASSPEKENAAAPRALSAVEPKGSDRRKTPAPQALTPEQRAGVRVWAEEICPQQVPRLVHLEQACLAHLRSEDRRLACYVSRLQQWVLDDLDRQVALEHRARARPAQRALPIDLEAPPRRPQLYVAQPKATPEQRQAGARLLATHLAELGIASA